MAAPWMGRSCCSVFCFLLLLTWLKSGGWKCQVPAFRGIHSPAQQRQPLSSPCLLPAPLSVSSAYFNTGTRKGRALSWNMGSVQHLDPENGKLTVPQEERGWVVVSGGRNLIQTCRVNKLQPHPYVWRVRTFGPGRGKEILWGTKWNQMGPRLGWAQAGGHGRAQGLCAPVVPTADLGIGNGMGSGVGNREWGGEWGNAME